MRNAIAKFQQYANFDDLKRSRRPRSLSDRNIRELKRLLQSDNRLSGIKITADLNMSSSKLVSKCILRRYMKERGYEYVIKIRRHWLSAKHRKARV